MKKIVLDASAMLALLNEEPGSEKLTPEMLNNSIGSTVNLAEVQTKLVSRGEAANEAWEDALSAIQESVPFTEEQAKIAGGLAAQTRSLGSSLGDRACLALGLVSKAPIYTTDRSWKDLNIGVRIHVIR
ncbi:MAG: type II toxin-antitoxin system VapC family toxin [Terriglobales bacterium]|jgi:PIN domain nuclease of toxin-antitoxin system